MIKSIKIKNIQSHKDSELKFSPGINCIVGSSNQGKSAILRALCWVRYNRPLGIDTLASHWIMSDKGNLTDEMSVEIINDNGSVCRKRSKNDNQYIVNNKELNVVKSDVPEEVFETLSLSDTNIQRQLDEPFLLSQTSGEVAKYFNKVVRLDIIDKVLSNAESKRRKTKSEIDQTEKLIQAQEDKQKSYDWIPEVEKLLMKYDTVYNKNELISDELINLKQDIKTYKECIENIDKYGDIVAKNALVDKLSRIDEKTARINDNRCYMVESLQLYKDNNDKIINKDFSNEKKLIQEFLNWNSNEDEIISLRSSIEYYTKLDEKIMYYSKEINNMKKQLPKVCPVCGQPWDCCQEL